MDLHFLEDETLTDNLDDLQASRLIRILERSSQVDPDHVDQVILFTKLLNQICLNN